MIPTGFLRIYLPGFLLAYLLISFLLPSWRVYRQTGINPFTFGKSDTAHDYIGRMQKGVTGLLAAAVLLFTISTEGYSYTLPIPFMQKPWIQATGFAVLHLSLLWICVAQYQMKTAWRIGIDEANRTELVTTGLFALSRNPVFLGMLFSLLGMFLVLPSTLTLLVLVVSYVLIQVQIRLEEEFLRRRHQGVYLQYCSRVRRLV